MKKTTFKTNLLAAALVGAACTPCFAHTTGLRVPIAHGIEAKPGKSGKLPVQIYSADTTNVQVTIKASDLEKQLCACEGSITKSITVHDDPRLPLVVM